MVGAPMGEEFLVYESPPHLGRGAVIQLRTHSLPPSSHLEVYLDQKAIDGLLEALIGLKTRLASKEPNV